MTIASLGTGRLFSARCCAAARLAAVATGTLLLAGCGPDIAPQPQTARPTERTQTDFGDLEVHYNAVRTDQLPVEMARTYGLERSANRVLLNVAMRRKTPGGAAVPVDGSVTVHAHNLNAQLKDLPMRRVQEGSAITFIGEVGISGEEILVFNITVEPAAGGGRHQVQFKREFTGD